MVSQRRHGSRFDIDKTGALTRHICAKSGTRVVSNAASDCANGSANSCSCRAPYNSAANGAGCCSRRCTLSKGGS